jgi:hypothetical protein
MRLLIAALLFTGLVQAELDTEQLSKEAEGQIKLFAAELMPALKKGLKSGGPEQAIGLCNLKAPDIAEKHSQGDWLVGRTSLKARNTHNRPDQWEQHVLEDFERRKAAGEPVAQLEASFVENGQFRYMKAIPTGNLCLNCHGEAISPAVAAKLDVLYPDDQARGFKVGDIRGAFTLSRQLVPAE